MTRNGEPAIRKARPVDTDAADYMPVADCAAQLGVTLPRLLRMLKKPEFANATVQKERQGRTGTRTVTCVSVSVLPDLKAAFDGGSGEQKQKHSRDEALPFFSDETTRAYLAAMMAQADARIKEQADTIADLRRDKEDLRSRLMLAEAEQQKRLQTEVLAFAAPIGDTTQEATHADLRGDSGELGQTAAHDKPRPFWAFWQKKKEGG